MSSSNNSKVILITGSTSGIGRTVAKGLLAKGYTVVIAGRNSGRIDDAIAWIKPSSEASKRLYSITLDLESLESIRNSVEQFKALGLQLDVLINNAGINTRKLEHVKDTFKVERSVFVNAVAPFYLSILLAPLMQPGGRIVFVTSGLHKPETTSGRSTTEDAGPINDPNLFNLLDGKTEGFEGFNYYRISKLAVVWITYVMAKQYPHLSIFSICPGFVPFTNLGREYPWYIRVIIRISYWRTSKTEEQCISEYTYYSTDKELDGVTGQYFSDGKKDKSSERSYNMDEAVKFWNLSCEICNVPEYREVK